MTGTLLAAAPRAALRTSLKILFVVESTATGVGRHVLDLADGMTARGHQVDLLYSPQREDGGFRQRRAHCPGVLCRAIPMRHAPGPADLAALRAIRGHIAEFGPYDVIHGHSSKGGMLARLAGIGQGGRVVYTPHAIVTLDSARPRALREVARIGEVALSHLSDAVIAVSEDEWTHMAGLGIPAAKLVVVPNGIEPPSPVPREQMRGELGLLPEDLAIGFVGRLCRQKAIDVMIEAFARLHRQSPRARLVVIGEGDAEPAARRQAAASGCGDAVLWLGAQDACRYYAAFDLLAQPSRYDGLSYSLLEAAAAGLPMVVTQVGGVRNVVEPGVNGAIVSAGEPEAFAAALCGLALDPRRLRRYTAAARARIVRGQQARMVSDTLSLYQSLMAGARPKKGWVPSMFRRSAKSQLSEAVGEPAVARQPMFTLFNKLALTAQGADGQVIQVIGARLGVGVSSIARALAEFAARHAEGPVLLVDANPLHCAGPEPRGAGELPSLEDIQSRPADWDQAVRPAAGQPGLFLATLSAPRDPRSESGQSIKGLAEIVGRLRSRFGWVVFDSAPPYDLPVALILSRFVDGTVIVVESDRTRLPVARQLIAELRANGGTPLGVIINKRRLCIPPGLYKFFC